MQVFIPFYKAHPNRFDRYEIRTFDDGAGHTATLRIALFYDKNKKAKEMVAQVIWDQHGRS
jgi:hypothetical protein